MARPIVMPSLGMYTTEGTITGWLRPPGSQVASGEAIIEITTEKATYQVEAPGAGIFHPVVAIGAILSDQGLIGYILAPGEAPPAVEAPTTPSPSVASAPFSMPPRPSAPIASEPRPPGGEVRASPIARRLAREQGIDLETIVGTGPGGRIVEADVIAAASRGASTAPAAAEAAAPARNIRARIPLVGIRKTIADRLKASLAATAPVTLTREVDAELFADARERLRARFRDGLPYDALFAKLVGLSLGEFPEFNSVIEDDAILQLGEIHIGVAVALPVGLVVPVVRDANSRSLAEIASDILSLSVRAKAGQLKAEDMAGGTFTITNLGLFGVDSFTPIINPPQAAILGIGRIMPRAVVRDGQIVVRRSCALSLTFDHRVADGAPAALLLDAVARKMADQALLDSLG